MFFLYWRQGGRSKFWTIAVTCRGLLFLSAVLKQYNNVCFPHVDRLILSSLCKCQHVCETFLSICGLCTGHVIQSPVIIHDVRSLPLVSSDARNWEYILEAWDWNITFWILNWITSTYMLDYFKSWVSILRIALNRLNKSWLWCKSWNWAGTLASSNSQ
jgi:hypothetical protein